MSVVLLYKRTVKRPTLLDQDETPEIEPEEPENLNSLAKYWRKKNEIETKKSKTLVCALYVSVYTTSVWVTQLF